MQNFYAEHLARMVDGLAALARIPVALERRDPDLYAGIEEMVRQRVKEGGDADHQL